MISLAHVSINRRLSRLAIAHNRPVGKLYRTQRLTMMMVVMTMHVDNCEDISDEFGVSLELSGQVAFLILILITKLLVTVCTGSGTCGTDSLVLALILITRLLVAVVLVFTISWLPLNLINVLLDLGVDQKLG